MRMMVASASAVTIALAAGCGVTTPENGSSASSGISVPANSPAPLLQALKAAAPELVCTFTDPASASPTAIFRGDCIDKAHLADTAPAAIGTQGATELLSQGCIPGLLIAAARGDWLTDAELRAALPKLKATSDDQDFACPQGQGLRSRWHTFLKGNLIVSSSDAALDAVVLKVLGPDAVDIESVT